MSPFCRNISMKNLVPYIQISKSQIYRLEKAGDFPQRSRVGAKRVVWDRQEVDAWMENKKALREPHISAQAA